jgi:hypothetical protein
VTEESNQPLVSVIMPCYKMGRFIGEASLLPNAKDNAFVEVVNFMSRRGYALFDVTDLNRSPNCGALCLMELAFLREGSWLRSQARW